MDDTILCVDVGTTNTRAWLTEGAQVLSRRQASVGARDTARDGHPGTLARALRHLLADLCGARAAAAPRRILAAGMISSPQGLCEVPHLLAPAGLAELAAASREQVLPQISDLPFLFVPGVRTRSRPGVEGISGRDVMRGEETLCLGLARLGLLPPGAALLSLGSHWKLIRLDLEGRVLFSITSIAGELLQAVRAQTILASALPDGGLEQADATQVRRGLQEARRAGLARALFCVRLLELAQETSPAERLSFALGALIGADLGHLGAALDTGTAVTIAGGEKTGGAWALALADAGHPVRSLSAAQVETGLLAGLHAIHAARVATA
ncbi:MAG: 2-dehydro-3-deoxygalactonokinase [Vicinamibacteria bacterium]